MFYGSSVLLMDQECQFCVGCPSRIEYFVSFLGFFSVLMRQTNIVWVGMALGMTVIDKFVSQTLPFVKDADKTTKVDSVYTFKVEMLTF